MERAPHAPEVGEAPYAQHVGTGLAKIGLVLRHEAWRRREGSGLTPTQGQILALLRSASGVGMSLSKLAAGLGVSAATASDSLRVLAEKGLVLKERSARDPRSLAVRLTATGEREAERAAEWPDFLLSAVGALSDEEQAVFLRALMKMIHELQEQGRIPVARMCASCRFFRPHAHRNRVRPHHCAFVGAPFGDRELRLDCADQDPLPPDEAQRVWNRFLAGDKQRARASRPVRNATKKTEKEKR